MTKQEKILRLHATAIYFDAIGSAYMAEYFRALIAKLKGDK